LPKEGGKIAAAGVKHANEYLLKVTRRSSVKRFGSSFSVQVRGIEIARSKGGAMNDLG
jgi:hypothetical protein